MNPCTVQFTQSIAAYIVGSLIGFTAVCGGYIIGVLLARRRAK